MNITSFEELECWKFARKLCNIVFQHTRQTAFLNDPGHVYQINNSAGSAMDNIAEGFGRRGNREFINFLSISLGSSNDCKSQIIRAYDKKYIESEEFQEAIKIADSTIKTTGGLLQYLLKSEKKGNKFD